MNSPEELANKISTLLNYRVYSESDKANLAAVVEELREYGDELLKEYERTMQDGFIEAVSLAHEEGFEEGKKAGSEQGCGGGK